MSTNSSIANWIYEKGHDDNIVLYSKVSIYRNLDNMRFFYHMDKEDFNKVENLLRDSIESLNLDLARIKLVDLSPLSIRILIENLTIPGHKNILNASLYTNVDESSSLLINSNEHLEIQTISRGLELHNCFDRAYTIENALDQKIDFAYDKKFGFLTSSPEIVGTSMNVQVCLSIPCLIWKTPDNIDDFVNECGKIGFEAEIRNGLLYIKNNIMIGVTEKFILDSMIEKVNEISEKEKKIRNRIKKLYRIKVEDRICRSKAILLSARSLKYKELINYNSWLRVGLYYGIIDDIELDTLYYILFIGKNNHLRELYQKSNYYKNVEEIRANVIRDILNKKNINF